MLSYTFLSPTLLEKISNKLSLQQNKPGLYLVATPIGNMFDISLRAIHILKTSKCVFAEDTRQARKLFDFYEIETPLIACHEYNEIDDSVISHIEGGEIYSLISDAGSPLISDPGYRLVNWCVEHKIDVFAVPGACAMISALSVSGLPTNNFAFYGFSPPKKSARRNFLENLKDVRETMIFYESPQRIVDFLNDLRDMFGNRQCCVCRELTKLYEEKGRGTIEEQITYFSAEKPRGEFVVVVAGKISDEETDTEDNEKMLEELKELMESESLSESVRKISEKYHASKKNIYQQALELKKNTDNG